MKNAFLTNARHLQWGSELRASWVLKSWLLVRLNGLLFRHHLIRRIYRQSPVTIVKTYTTTAREPSIYILIAY